MNAHLAVIDMQNVFADPVSGWFVPRFNEVLEPIHRLVEVFEGRTTFTRFVAPTEPSGAWRNYYQRWPFAVASPDAEMYALVDDFISHRGQTLDATMFGKWAAGLGDRAKDTLVLAGVSTECCVLSTALAAADAGVRVFVATDACAAGDDASHAHALAVLELFSPLIELRTAEEIIASTVAA